MPQQFAITEQTGVGNGGWIRFRHRSTASSAYLRFEESENERLAVADFVILSDNGISDEDVKCFRIAHIQGLCNTDADLRERIKQSIGLNSADVRGALYCYNRTFGSRARDNWVTQMWRHGRPPEIDVSSLTEPLDGEAWTEDDPDLVIRSYVRDADTHPNEFYEEFAAAYALALRYYGKYAPKIADANGVELSTVHRWARVARQRGFLPKASPGKAG